MSSLLPLIQDLLPMIMPSSISIARAGDIRPASPPSLGDHSSQLSPTTTQARPSTAADSNGGDGDGDSKELQDRDPALPPPRAIRRDAIVNKTDKMCASVLIAKAKSSSAVHHNGEQDSIIYAASGRGILLTSPEGESDAPERHEIAPGDFVFVPAWTEHRLLNETGEEVVWVVVRSGGTPVQVDLTHWGGPEIRRAPRAKR